MLWPEVRRWSSGRARLEGIYDGLTSRGALEAPVVYWRGCLDDMPPSRQADRIRCHARTGRPLGTPAFVAGLERGMGRPLAPARRGRKRKETPGVATD